MPTPTGPSRGGSCVPAINRRGFLLGAGALVTWASVPRLALAADGRDPRYLVVLLRGALDGLGAVAPTFDPAYERMRAGLLIGEDGDRPGLPLDDGFLLNPHLATLHRLYLAGEATVVHAVATPYRDRSHFDGQDVLESGLPGLGRLDAGWMNRLLTHLPAGGAVGRDGLGIGATVPLIMAGPAPVTTWMPPKIDSADADTRMRLLSLYEAGDPELARLLAQGLDLDALTVAAEAAKPGRTPFAVAMEAVGTLLADPAGPRIGTIDIDGWDTHAAEAPVTGRLGVKLGELDAGIAVLKTSLGAAWRDTVVVMVTEFGRTVRMNGTAGTDHGTGTIALLVGGAVRGGRVVADWPGIGESELLEGRDLRPTTDLRAVLKGTLADHLGVGAAALADVVFPGSGGVRPLADLIV